MDYHFIISRLSSHIPLIADSSRKALYEPLSERGSVNALYSSTLRAKIILLFEDYGLSCRVLSKECAIHSLYIWANNSIDGASTNSTLLKYAYLVTKEG